MVLFPEFILCHPVLVTEYNWDALAQAARTRRESLGLRLEDIAGRGGPARATVWKIEKGEPGTRSASLAGLDRALRWKPGTAQAILSGTAPTDPRAWVDSPRAGDAADMPQFEVSPETQDLLAQNNTARAGLAFLDLVHRHYGAERESANVDQAVRDFVRFILAAQDAG